MKIVLISTLAHNPGDEFIRLGAEQVLRQVFPQAEFRPIHKQDPRTLFAGFKRRAKTPHRFVSPLLYRFYSAAHGHNEENYLDTADLVVFAGSPFIWRSAARLFPSTCANAEWVAPTWSRLFNELEKIPVFNLAAGASAFSPRQFDAVLTDSKVARFLRRAMLRTELTTARDVKTQEILAALGCQTDVIPCLSLLAAKGAGLTAGNPEYVVINLMPAAAPSGRAQRGEPSRWLETISAVVPEIEKRHSVMFVSHFADEHEAAAKYFPGRPRFYSKDPIELMKVYSKAIYGICNRVHSGAAIASFARPVISVGGDFRNRLFEQFGLSSFDHRDLDASKLRRIIAMIEGNYDSYVSVLRDRIIYAEREYLRILSDTPTARRLTSKQHRYAPQCS
jgi:polysaccharide pyruvyl transferase WcaK-like protein